MPTLPSTRPHSHAPYSASPRASTSRGVAHDRAQRAGRARAIASSREQRRRPGCASLRVERLDRVRDRVERRSSRSHARRQVEREQRVVDHRRGQHARVAAAWSSCRRVGEPVDRRHLRARSTSSARPGSAGRSLSAIAFASPMVEPPPTGTQRVGVVHRDCVACAALASGDRHVHRARSRARRTRGCRGARRSTRRAPAGPACRRERAGGRQLLELVGQPLHRVGAEDDAGG